jgi:hypothetical protein
MMKERKVTHVAVCTGGAAIGAIVVCDDNTLWRLALVSGSRLEWVRLPDLPQGGSTPT